MQLTQELQYLLVVIGLFIVPRILQRYRLPSAISCLGLGALLSMGFHLLHNDSAMPLLSTLGIVTLFLFAGLEVDFSELRQGLNIMLGHLFVQTVLLVIGSALAMTVFELRWRPALLLALAVFTPSTGFILDSLPAFGLSAPQQFWVKTKAIGSELLALAALFITVQSTSPAALGLSTLALVIMIALLPTIFRVFAAKVLPYAPKSEFAFLVILAMTCAYITRHLGVYYLVGAFVVGVTAIRLRKQLPVLASEKIAIGIELFASFFIPFYFFKAGLHLQQSYFTARAIGLGLLFVAVIVPIRIGVGAIYRRIVLQESMLEAVQVGLSLTPTLVFTIVLADILRQQYALPDYLYGALLVFTITNTALPGFILRTMPPEFDTPEAFRDHKVDPPHAIDAEKQPD